MRHAVPDQQQGAQTDSLRHQAQYLDVIKECLEEQETIFASDLAESDRELQMMLPHLNLRHCPADVPEDLLRPSLASRDPLHAMRIVQQDGQCLCCGSGSQLNEEFKHFDPAVFPPVDCHRLLEEDEQHPSGFKGSSVGTPSESHTVHRLYSKCRPVQSFRGTLPEFGISTQSAVTNDVSGVERDAAPGTWLALPSCALGAAAAKKKKCQRSIVNALQVKRGFSSLTMGDNPFLPRLLE
eukprot:5853505-Amphidinium_carterae.1